LHIKATPTLNGAKPLRQREGDGGIDVALPQAIIIPPWRTAKVDTGWSIEMPDDWHLIALQKSRYSGILLVEAPLIDNAYRGSIHALLHNIDGETITLERGDYVMQLLPVYSPFMPIDVVNPNQMTITERGEGAFGSTK